MLLYITNQDLKHLQALIKIASASNHVYIEDNHEELEKLEQKINEEIEYHATLQANAKENA